MPAPDPIFTNLLFAIRCSFAATLSFLGAFLLILLTLFGQQYEQLLFLKIYSMTLEIRYYGEWLVP